MIMPAAVARQAEIAQVVADVEREFSRDIAYIRYNFDLDWSDDWGLFFRIVLKDSAARGKRLRRALSEIRSRMSRELESLNLGVFIYFNFRSESEQAELKDEAWA